jgi:hypothetical protein
VPTAGTLLEAAQALLDVTNLAAIRPGSKTAKEVQTFEGIAQLEYAIPDMYNLGDILGSPLTCQISRFTKHRI